MTVCASPLYTSPVAATGGVTFQVAVKVASPEPMVMVRGSPDAAMVVLTAVPSASVTFQPANV